VNGALAAYISRGGRQLLVFVPEDEPARSTIGRALARRLAVLARGEEGRGGLLVSDINGMPAQEHSFATFLAEAGFNASPMGFQMRRPPAPHGPSASAPFVRSSSSAARDDDDSVPSSFASARRGRGDERA
jgi:ATP-dependent Lhr-like helicase